MIKHKVNYLFTGSVPGREDHFFQGGDPRIVHESSVFIYYVRTQKGVILIDSSFHMDDMKSLGIDKEIRRELPEQDPLYALGKVDIGPEDVDKLILTHAHADHIGYADAFPNAEVFIHEKEYLWVRDLPSWSVGYGTFSKEKLKRVGQRLTLIKKDIFSLVNGIDILYIGGHTAGSTAVRIETISGKVMLCSDNCFLYKNAEENLPIGLTNNLYENMTFIRSLRESGDIIIPGHDPKVLQQYPSGCIA